MLRAGLTGNIGSGKSAVAAIFSSIGIPVFNADNESRKFLKLPHVIDSFTEFFGTEIMVDGVVNNKRLASLVFSNRDALDRLNHLLHPLVMKEFTAWQALNGMSPYVIMEAAILFESGYAKEFDYIIAVSCGEETAVERVIKRDGLSRELVMERMNQQMNNEDKTGMSDFVIINDGSQLIIPQVISIHKQILQRIGK